MVFCRGRKILAAQPEGYLRWIVENFSARDWGWVDSAKAALDRSDGYAQAAGFDRIWEEQVGISDPSTSAYASILRRCSEQRDLQTGIRVHAHIVENGYARDPFVENQLIQMYGKCRRIDLARIVFDAKRQKDLFTWNIMISAYAQNGHFGEALAIFKQMGQDQVEPDCYVLATILGVFARSGSVQKARKIFDSMRERDPASWTAMISAYAQQGHSNEAVELYRRMNQEGVEPNRLTYITVLGACGGIGSLSEGKAVHDRFISKGFCPDLVIESALLNLYSKCGSLEEAKALFDRMQEKDTASWTSMIEAYTRHGCGDEAIGMYRRMDLEGIPADSITFVAVLGACSICGFITEGKAIHTRIAAIGVDRSKNIKVSTALLNLYAKCGSVIDARAVFDRIDKKDLICWNTMLQAHARHEDFAGAFEIFESMNISPDSITFGTLLTACCSRDALRHGQDIHARIKRGEAKNLEIEMFNLLLNMFAKCGSIEEARSVFDRMPARNMITWNAMLVWYARYGVCRAALGLYKQMLGLPEMEPDVVTCIGALAACSSLGDLGEGRAIHSHILAAQFKPDVVLWTSLLNMYAKCGSIHHCRTVFDQMPVKNAVSFNAMIAANAHAGDLRGSLRVYSEMVLLGFVVDTVTLLCVLVACNHAGRHMQGIECFVRLRGDHWIDPALDHYHCLVDLLSRAGRLGDAEDLLRSMPFQPGAIGWKSLLNGCAVHGDARRGAKAAMIACKLDPVDSSQYVLLSNLYAWFGKHKDGARAQLVIRDMEKLVDDLDHVNTTSAMDDHESHDLELGGDFSSRLYTKD